MPVDSPNRSWQRALTTLSAVVVFVVIVFALYWARSVFLPVALAIFLAFVLSPIAARLRRLGLGRVPAVLVTVTITTILVVAVGSVLAWQLTALTQSLPDRTEKIKDKLAKAKQMTTGDGQNRYGKMAEDIGATFAPPPKKDPNATTVVVESADSSWMNRAPEFLSPATEFFGQGAFALVLAVFMLFKQDDLRNRLIRLVGDTKLTAATKAVDDASRRISRYLLMQLLINTAFGMLIALAMFIIGVPYALLWGFIASVMRYIPYLGTWLGLIPPIIMTLAFTDEWWQLIAVLGVYGGLELACNNLIEPRAYGKSMGLSEVAQLVSAAFWALLWGPVGLILSGPLTVCLLVLGKNVPWLSFLEVLLGDEPVLSADVRFYQRLNARDQDEASDIVRQELKTRSTVEVFDGVVIPALTYAKRDLDRSDLTAEHLAGMLKMTREIVDEMADREIERVADSTELEPLTEKVRVLAVPAHDETDEVAVEMLRALLDARMWELEVAPVAQLTSEVVNRAKEFDPAVIVIGSLPPGGLAHTRYVCKRIARQFPEARIVVGRWGVAEPEPESRAQLTDAGATHVTESLAETTLHLQSWLAALDSKQKAAGKADERELIGTASAK